MGSRARKRATAARHCCHAQARATTSSTARRPGKWLVHCHIPHHAANNNVEEKGGGGLTRLIEVAP